LLEGLSIQTHRPDEIILVMDGSTDNSAAIAAEWRQRLPVLQIVTIPNAGRAGARNAGAKLAQGDLLIFLDDDLVIPAYLIERHVAFHSVQSESSALIGLALVRLAGDTGPMHSYRCHLESKWESKQTGRHRLRKESFSFSAANASVPSLLFQSMGGFDNRLTDAEDWEFGARLMLRDTPVWLDTDLTVGHKDMLDLNGFIRRQIQHYRSKIALDSLFPHYKAHFPYYFASLGKPSPWKARLRSMYPYTLLHPLVNKYVGYVPHRLLSYHIHSAVLKAVEKL
jgi:glycosyltransferase involved in cell wall biosynthesis